MQKTVRQIQGAKQAFQARGLGILLARGVFGDLVDVRVAAALVIGQLLLAQKREHPVDPPGLRGRADPLHRRAVQISDGFLPRRAQKASHQQLKHRVAAVRQPQHADLVDLARGHRQMKQIFQADLLRNT